MLHLILGINMISIFIAKNSRFFLYKLWINFEKVVNFRVFYALMDACLKKYASVGRLVSGCYQTWWRDTFFEPKPINLLKRISSTITRHKSTSTITPTVKHGISHSFWTSIFSPFFLFALCRYFAPPVMFHVHLMRPT